MSPTGTTDANMLRFRHPSVRLASSDLRARLPRNDNANFQEPPHDPVHRRLGPHPLRQARRARHREPDRLASPATPSPMPASSRRRSTASSSASSTTASPSRTSRPRWCCHGRCPSCASAGDPLRERLRHRLGRDPWRPRLPARRPRPHRAGGRRREDDRDARRRRSATSCSPPPTARRRARSTAASPASSAASPSLLPALRRPVATRWPRIAAKNHANGVANPYAQMRKDLGFDFCNTVSDKNPYVAGAARSAPTARWSPTAPPRWC